MTLEIEVVGDTLPTPAERAELEAYYDSLEQRELQAQIIDDAKDAAYSL